MLAFIVLFGFGLHNANGGAAVAWDGHDNLTTAYGGPVQRETQRALQTARRKGWAHATIIASSNTAGYGAIAVALHPNGYGSMIGVSLGNRSADQARKLAMDLCRKGGGTRAKVKWSFLDEDEEHGLTRFRRAVASGSG